MRGVRIGTGVFIGDEVYLENEYPESVEIQDGVQISVRATLIAHTRGPGRIILEKDAFIGPHAVILASRGRTVRIGEGAVIGAGCVVTRDVRPRTFIAGEFGRAVGEVRIPLAKAASVEDFIKGLVPIKSRLAQTAAGARSATHAAQPARRPGGSAAGPVKSYGRSAPAYHQLRR
jgi:carbonic anhydrase/acetyltransferase-like protein (isoleucine patch superfamily)